MHLLMKYIISIKPSRMPFLPYVERAVLFLIMQQRKIRRLKSMPRLFPLQGVCAEGTGGFRSGGAAKAYSCRMNVFKYGMFSSQMIAAYVCRVCQRRCQNSAEYAGDGGFKRRKLRSGIIITKRCWSNALPESRCCRYRREEHYNLISACIKSMRNSDVAAIYWLMNAGGGGGPIVRGKASGSFWQ